MHNVLLVHSDDNNTNNTSVNLRGGSTAATTAILPQNRRSPDNRDDDNNSVAGDVTAQQDGIAFTAASADEDIESVFSEATHYTHTTGALADRSGGTAAGGDGRDSRKPANSKLKPTVTAKIAFPHWDPKWKNKWPSHSNSHGHGHVRKGQKKRQLGVEYLTAYSCIGT